MIVDVLRFGGVMGMQSVVVRRFYYRLERESCRRLVGLVKCVSSRISDQLQKWIDRDVQNEQTEENDAGHSQWLRADALQECGRASTAQVLFILLALRLAALALIVIDQRTRARQVFIIVYPDSGHGNTPVARCRLVAFDVMLFEQRTHLFGFFLGNIA